VSPVYPCHVCSRQGPDMRTCTPRSMTTRAWRTPKSLTARPRKPPSHSGSERSRPSPGHGVAVEGRPHRSGRAHNARGNYTQVSRSWPFPPDAGAAGEVGSSRFKRWSIRSLFVFK
jgi:hypothetical protein